MAFMREARRSLRGRSFSEGFLLSYQSHIEGPAMNLGPC